MKKYIKFLIVFLVIDLLLGGIPVIYKTIGLSARRMSAGERQNQVCITTQRVFDYADVLTERQEKKLEKLIAKRERQLGLDIVIVTICEDVGSDPYNASINHTIDFAEDFYTYHGFGYDGFRAEFDMSDGSQESTNEAGKKYMTDNRGTVTYAEGAGVIWVDNWFDLNGYAESAFLAYRGAGNEPFFDKAYTLYLAEDTLLELENDVWAYSNTNPYKSYRRMVNHLASDMVGFDLIEVHLPVAILFFLALVASLIFVLVNLKKKLGKKTTEKSTYVQGGKAQIVAQRDVLVSKHTTKRHIERSSSGGGGHSGGGGGGHSGGHSGGGGRH